MRSTSPTPAPLTPKREDRLHSDKPPDNRLGGQRDRDRILYTSAFRRLAGVTQVVAAEEGHVFHNRLTHSLEVAQVARRTAEKLLREQADVAARIQLDADVAEACALAHDLGHPPFGHVGEEELKRRAVDAGLPDGFEGNAQSFRIVTKLALHSPKHPGLNLTRATLNGILKYPWLHQESGKASRKWGAYESERDEFNWVREIFEKDDIKRSPEAELMDWADDITYAVHDAVDFYRAGLIPLDRLSLDPSERKRFFQGVVNRYESEKIPPPYPHDQLQAVFSSLIEFFPFDECYRGTKDHRSRLRFYSASLIKRYIYAIELVSDSAPRFVHVDPESEKEVIMWKELTWHYVILNPALVTQQHGQRRVIGELFDILLKAAVGDELTLFPHAIREELTAAKGLPAEEKRRQLVRTIADFIAGMAEPQAVKLHQRLTGVSLGSALMNFGLGG